MTEASEQGSGHHPVRVSTELHELHQAIVSGSWEPSAPERAAARRLAAARELTAAAIRSEFAHEVKGQFFLVMERVAAILDLPAVHEDPTTRAALKQAASDLLTAIAK